jgi:hypothetical protein
MPRYTVHGPSAEPDAIRQSHLDLRFVKDGFSWWGLFVPLIWLLVKRMWIVLFLALAACVVIDLLAYWSGLGDAGAAAATLAVNLIVGFEGNDLQRWSMGLRGFREIGFASGADRDEAEFRFFAALPEAAPAPVAAPPFPAGTHDPLGLFGAVGTA